MNSISAWSARQRYALCVAGVVAATLAMTQLPDLHETTIALIYLLMVLLSATTIGLGPAILASLLAFLAFNYFFVPPLHTLAVSNPQDLVRLLTFLAVAILTSSLASRARQQADTAQRSAADLAALYGLSQALSAEVTQDGALPVVAQTTIQLVSVPICTVLLYDEYGRLIERASAGAMPDHPSRAVDTFLRIGPRILGVLRVIQRSLQEPLSPAEHERLETIASQTVLVLERARLVEELSQARAQAESERIKATLFTSVSHDLRTPLATIKGAATELLDPSTTHPPAAQRDLLAMVNEEADRLNRLVGNLVDMSRIESGAPATAHSWHDIGELIANVVARLKPQLADRSVTLDLAADLPAVAISYMQIDQVLTNLLENVVKYTPPATPIDVSAHAEHGAIVVEVSDRGAGIPSEMIGRIFEKFVRAAPPERHAPGSGLGLAICKGIVELHGGQIWAENRPGGGARFAFTLPIEQAAAVPPAPLVHGTL